MGDLIYLVDSSIWIDYFRGRNKAIINTLERWLSEKRIVTNGAILSELLVGARGNKESKLVENVLNNLSYLETGRDFYSYCGYLGNDFRRKGITLPFSDIMIAAHAKRNNLIIFTRDKHFEKIGKNFGIQFARIVNFYP